MWKQLSLLPLTHQFNRWGDLENTTYWEIDDCKKNPYYIVFNKETYCMLLHEDNYDWLGEIIEAETLVITKGRYNGIDGYHELMFIDENKPPYTVMVPSELFSFEMPPKENCWYGQFFIYVGGLYNCKNYFYNVYYRVADSLPCCKPVEE